jgi:hypothetical protein
MLRPLGVGEILDAAFKIYTRNLWSLMKIVAVVVVPIQALAGVIFLSTLEDPDALTGDGDVDEGSETWGFVAGNFVGSILGWIALTIATGAVVKAIADIYLARNPDWRESLRYAGGRWHSLIWLAFLGTALLIPAFVALIVPGIWLWIAWIVAVPALMIEGCRGRKALGRSFRLVRKRWWPTFAVIVIAYILASVIQGVVGGALAAGIFAADDSLLLAVILNAVFTSIASIIATPFQAAVTTVTYFDLRVRKEGFDLQLLAERMGGTAPEQAPYAAGEGARPEGAVFEPDPADPGTPLPERPAGPDGG